ncbi:MAG: FHA domain-containing protein [Propionibacteriaceae bacterium]|nr:FHA domain-containing protein [Propionibacteriaceae bacterium]
MSLPIGPWRLTYTPGQWMVLAGPKLVAVMQPAPPKMSSLVNQLWSDIQAARSLSSLLNVLRGYSLDQMPDFAAFVWEGGALHGLARGRIQVVDTSTGETALDGEGALTWHEAHFGQVRGLRIEMAQVDHETVLHLPLVVGAVGASALHLTTDPAQLVMFPDTENQLPEPSAPAPTRSPEPLAPVSGSEPSPVEESSPGLYESPSARSYEEPRYDEPRYEEPRSYEHSIPQPSYEEPRSYEDPVAPPSYSHDPYAAPQPSYQSPVAPAPVPVAPAPSPVAPPAPAPVALDATEGMEHHDDFAYSRPAEPVMPSVAMGIQTNTGEFQNLVNGLVIGRAPDASRGPAGVATMRVPSPGNDISRSHVLVQPEGRQARITDLDSTNGTTIQLADDEPFLLEDGQSVLVPIGTVLNLGDGVSMRIEQAR